jgi:type III pantothenate kinase
MKPDVVVDVGNTRIKWARCAPNTPAPYGITFLPPDDEAAWQRQIDLWGLPSPTTWLVAGVHPARRDRLVEWLRGRGNHVRVIDSPEQLPLRVLLDEPQKVGIDRLLNAVGGYYIRNETGPWPDDPRQSLPLVIVSAGTAVTVDLVDWSGAFRGGAILPGFRMMAQALHEHTALLPLIDPLKGPAPETPGRSTSAAMKAGIFWAVSGGVRCLIEKYAEDAGQPVDLYITGGNGSALSYEVSGLTCVETARSITDLTLLGLRLTAESLP